MRKCMMIVLCMLLVFGTSGCSGSKKASDKALSVGKQALSVVDGYLDGSLDYDEAISKLDELEEEMEYVDDLAHDDENTLSDFSISVSITGLSTYIITDDYEDSSESYDKLLEKRNNLAEEVGEKKR